VPSIIIIAGPNGAGKTTFANEYLSAEETRFEFVNADEIARGLDVPVRTDMLAGRMMLERIDELVAANSDFVVETTLAGLTYAQKIPVWRERGYVVSLAYLRLDSVAESIARVQKRVAAGGHGIPETAIRRRFAKSLHYLETIYKYAVDEWYMWKSQDGSFTLIDSWDGRHASRT
jgi:predicted ABC-type ATPase